MTNTQFKIMIRSQFSFNVDDLTLSCILNEMANQGLNIDAFQQNKFKNNHKYKNMVRLVVGSVNSESKKDLMAVKEILRTLEVEFHHKMVLQIELIPGVSGQINTIFGALWCELKVYAIYAGEGNRLFLDVSDTKKAIEVLSQPQINPCPKNC